MVVPFGFSVGDIIAGIGVIKDSVQAFSDTRGATKDHKLLCDTLTRLCASLKAVRDLGIDPVHDVRQQEAIRQDVDQCQSCIDDFVCRIAKYKIIQPSTQPLSWESRVKVAAKKIQWALLKQDDLSKFKTDVQLQFDSITVLLISLQDHRQRRQVSMLDNVTASQAEALNISREQTVSIQELRTGNGKMVDMAEEQLSITRNTQGHVQALKALMPENQCSMLEQILQQQASHYELLLESQSKSHQLLHQQFRSVQLIVDAQSQNQLSMSDIKASLAQITLHNDIPPQVLLQRPVLFRDALDRVTPIHLDFINSPEAFLAVLKIRFKGIGSEKLDRNEYTLTDDKQNRNLDIRKPWCSVMKPGQHVSMSMVFDTRFQQNICPGCSATNEAQKGEETTCIHCNLTYRLFEETIVRKDPLGTNLYQEWKKRQYDARHSEIRDESANDALDLGSTSEVTITDFRRVHLINRGFAPAYRADTFINASTRIHDMRPEKTESDSFCRKQLTTYEVFTIRPSPDNGGKDSEDSKDNKIDAGDRKRRKRERWAKVQIYQESYPTEQIIMTIQKLNTGRLSITEKKARLFPNQSSQVYNILDNKIVTERESQSFEWVLAQLHREESTNLETGRRWTTSMTIFLKRVPLPGIDVVQLYREQRQRLRAQAFYFQQQQQAQISRQQQKA